MGRLKVQDLWQKLGNQSSWTSQESITASSEGLLRIPGVWFLLQVMQPQGVSLIPKEGEGNELPQLSPSGHPPHPSPEEMVYE